MLQTVDTSRLRVGPGFKLADIDPGSTLGYKGSREQAEAVLEQNGAETADLQERMFAQLRAGLTAPSVLVVLQGMDASGKGGIIRHVIGGVDPQGVHIASFKAPTAEERAHDFLWRIRAQLPKPGFIGVFDRSHYEDVLVQRVRAFAPPEEIERRYGAINDFEREIVDGGTAIIKILLHLSKDEQAERLLERIERPDKHWKYSPGDIDERELWPEYQRAFQIVLDRTSTEYAPWHVVPADKKWFSRLAAKELLLQTLRGLDLGWPPPAFDIEAERRRLADS